jgi:Lrp/AsnC family transcriptional regulator
MLEKATAARCIGRDQAAQLLDPLKLGLGLTAFVSVQVDDHSGKAIARFAAEIAAMEEVMECYRMAGDANYGLRVVVPDGAAFDVLYKRLIENNSAQERYVAFRFGKRQIRTALPILLARANRARAGALASTTVQRYTTRVPHRPPVRSTREEICQVLVPLT